MLSGAPIVPGADALAEAKAYLRVVGSDEDALIARSVLTGAEHCERFIGQALMLRAFAEILPANAAWTRLGARPVSAIAGVAALASDGAATMLDPSAYAIDIDAAGDGWIRILDPGAARRVRADYEAGMASEWSAIAEPLRQGVVRLAAHLFTHRDAAVDPGPPAAVTALWRPYRRMRIG